MAVGLSLHGTQLASTACDEAGCSREGRVKQARAGAKAERVLEPDELHRLDESGALRLVDVNLVPEPDLVLRAV